MVQNTVNEFQLLLKASTYVRTHWWLFLLEIIAIYSVSLHKFHKTPPVFESDASILIDTSRRQIYQSVMPGLSGTNNARKQNMANLLSGAEIMERFRTQLIDYYNNEGRPNHLRPYFPGGTAFTAERFRRWIYLNWDKNSDIYNIHCTAETAHAAHDLCLIYLNTIQSYYPEIGQRDVMMKRDFLSRQIASFISQIKEREQDIIAFQRANEEFFNFIIMSVEERGLQKLRTERANIMHRLATNRAIHKLIMSVPRAKRGEHTARTMSINALTQKVGELQFQLQLLEQDSTQDVAARRADLQKQLAEATQQLAQLNEEDVDAFRKAPLPAAEVRRKVAELELEYRTDTIKLENVEREIENLSSKEKKYNQPRLEYERMLTELNHKKKLLINLYQKEQETELELSAGNAEIFRLMEPTMSGLKTAPQLSKHLYAGLSFSIFVVIITIVLLMAFFPRLDSEAEVHRLNLPVLGKVPLLKRFKNVTDEIPGYGLEHLKIMIYRIVRETKDLKCPIVVISSPHAREGKSTVTHFLSIASQNPNRKTLLIDGDLLTAHPNKFFGFSEDSTPGLSSVLEKPDFKDWKSLIVKTDQPGIDFMPRGGRLESATLPHFLKPIEGLLHELKNHYDMIFIDTPPLFASNLAHQWAGLGDLVVLVARIYSTRPKDIQEAIQTCKVFSKAPVGIALNCVRLSGPNKRASNYYFSKKKVVPPRLAA